MKKLLTVLFAAQATYWPSNSNAVPDPRDSVIIESGNVTIGQSPVTVRVFITNKDTLTGFEIPLVMRSISGGAYMRLTYPREFGGCVRPLDSTLHSFSIVADYLYDGLPPDTFNAAGFRDPADPSTKQPPNSTRKALVELKFDSLSSTPGIIELDSAFIWVGAAINRVGFVSYGRGSIDVNFVKGRITVVSPPCPYDANDDKTLSLADLVLARNCMLGYGVCEKTLTSSEFVILINNLFPTSGPTPLIPPTPCEP